MFDWFLNQIKAQDYFANKVTLTQKGKKDFRSLIGGVVSIITCLSVVAYGLWQMHDLYFHPVYNSYPVTYDFDKGKILEWDVH